jgi:hypothetical protein
VTGSRFSRKTVAVFTVVLLLGAGGAVALAQTQRDDRAAGRQAFIDDVAKRLGVSSADLEQALTDAQIAQIDKALADGRLTQEQADRMKEWIQSGKAPLFGLPLDRGFRGHGDGPHGGFGFGPGRGFHHGPPAFFDAAASYLGLSAEELRAALADGTSLADVAADEGKSAEGLEDAIVAAVEKELDQAVEDGRLTEARKTEFLDRFREHVSDLVRHGWGGLPGPWRDGEKPGDGGPSEPGQPDDANA